MSSNHAKPLKKNWQQGQYQIGLFLRTPAGGVIEVVSDKPTEAMVEAANALFKALTK